VDIVRTFPRFGTKQTVIDRRADREERVWVDRARQGDPAGHRWLLERYRSRALRLAASILRRPDEAEDIAQEAFIQAFRRLKQLKNRDRFGPWLLAIVSRTCFDRMRLCAWSEEIGIESEIPQIGPDEAVTTKLLVERLLDVLSPPMRAALLLREAEGMDYDEIAVALEIPVGTVRSRLHTARQQFKEMYEQALEETNHA
jgi:RNA polymerase sigma-70 factor (ECF subfamily)